MADVKFRAFREGAATAGSTQDFDITGFGTPDAALFFHNEANTTENGAAVSVARSGIGFCDDTNERAVAYVAGNAYATSATARQTLPALYLRFLAC